MKPAPYSGCVNYEKIVSNMIVIIRKNELPYL